MRALAPDVTGRYQRAADLLDDVLGLPHGARPPQARRGACRAGAATRGAARPPRSAPREATPRRFCWQCRKPLHARTDRCPFCGETQ